VVTRLAVIVAMHAGMKRRGRAKNGSSRSIGVHTHIYIYTFLGPRMVAVGAEVRTGCYATR
jgi:hypothetical protein